MATFPFTSGWDGLGAKDAAGGTIYALMRVFSAGTSWSADSTGTLTGTTNTTTPFYKVILRQGMMEFDPGEGSHAPEGVNAWTTNLNMYFTKYAATLRNFIYTMAVNDVEYIVYGNNGDYILGSSQSTGAFITASSAKLGKDIADPNGASVSLQAKVTKPAPLVSATLISSFTIV